MNDTSNADGDTDRVADPEDPGLEPLLPDVPVESEPTMTFLPVGTEADAEPTGRLAGAFRWALMITRGPQAGLTYVLPEGETLVGRSGDAEIFLGDVTVSREHARLVVDDRGLKISDLGSTNGIYVNGQRRESAVLQANDDILIGKFRLRVVRGNA